MSPTHDVCSFQRHISTCARAPLCTFSIFCSMIFFICPIFFPVFVHPNQTKPIKIKIMIIFSRRYFKTSPIRPSVAHELSSPCSIDYTNETSTTFHGCCYSKIHFISLFHYTRLLVVVFGKNGFNRTI